MIRKYGLLLALFLIIQNTLIGYSGNFSQIDYLADSKLCILAIGNSFSEDAVENYLYDLCKEEGIEVVIGNMYIGGCTLEKHWNNLQGNNDAYSYRKVIEGDKYVYKNVTLESVINDEKWDIITFQQASGLSGIYTTYDPYLANLISWFRENSEAQLWFHQTWAYSQDSTHPDFANYDYNQLTMYYAIVDALKNVMADHQELVNFIPSGTAIQNVRTSYLGDTLNRDGYHLETTYGRYTAACTWFEKLTGLDVRNDKYYPLSIDERQKETVQMAVHYAVMNPYEITDIPPIVYPSDILLNYNTVYLEQGETVQLEVEIAPEDTTDKTVSWESSNENVAIVSENGLVKAISSGLSVITATCGEVSDECYVNVLEDASLESLLSEPEKEISIYSPDGILIKKNCKVEDMKILNNGIYIIVSGKEHYKISI